MQTVNLIDLSSVFWRFWHATKDQEIGTAAENTLSYVYRFGGDLCGIALDAPPYKRQDLYPEYKATRDKHEAVAVEQLERVCRQLRADGYPLYAVPGYEADDVIASLVREIHSVDIADMVPSPIAVVVHSGDKDLLQLVSDRVSVRSTSTGEIYTASDVRRKFGVDPSGMICYLALTGDASDNVPGCPGVGAKRAAQYTEQFGGDVKRLLEAAREDGGAMKFTPASIGESIQRHADQIEMSAELVRLVNSLDLDVPLITRPRKQKPGEMDSASAQPVEVIEAETVSDTATEPAPEPPPGVENVRGGIMVQPTMVLRPMGADYCRALEPNTIDAAWKLSGALFESRLYPKFSNREALFAVLLRGRALGLDATASLEGFHVIEGKPCPSAQLIVGLVLRSGKAKYFYKVRGDESSAEWATWREGNPTEQRSTFTLAAAEKRGLLAPSKTGRPTQWAKFPDVMLSWRAATILARDVYADVVGGLYTPDEIEADG